MTDIIDSQNIIELERLKNYIEKMDKFHHIEILKILKKYSFIKLNENKSGVFINLSFLPKATLSEIEKYIEYVSAQEDSIRLLESQCENFKNTYFNDKEDKDNSISYAITNTK